LVVTVDCNSRYVQADPEIGTMIAVSEAARNITCTGGEPSAITNCLNFGNPYNPEAYWQFVGAIKGMGAACIKFQTPVTGGNVSFYNQSKIGDKVVPVFPTPTIGMLGIMEDKKYQTTLSFEKEGDSIYVVGELTNDINSSEYLYSFVGEKNTPAPYFDLEKEYAMHQAIKAIIKGGLATAIHDVADGGIICALLESSFQFGLGFDIQSPTNLRKDAFLFGEGQGRAIVAVSPDKKAAFEASVE